ncbi:hypothetical protein [Actinomadura napierensis]
MNAKRRRSSAGPYWPMLVGLIATGFLLYVWVWASTQGGPPF